MNGNLDDDIKRDPSLQSLLQDLYNWENEIKRKDEEIRRKKTTSPKLTRAKIEEIPPKKSTNCQVHERTTKNKPIIKKQELEEESSTTSSSEEDEEAEMELKKQRAALEKDKGNKFFKEGKYDEAIACYTTGIQLDPVNAILPANRALALLRKGQYAAAEQDCTMALNWDPSYVKAYHRRGIIRVKMKKYALAREDFKKALKLDPANKETKQELEKVEKILEKQPKKTENRENGPTEEKALKLGQEAENNSDNRPNAESANEMGLQPYWESWEGASGKKPSNIVEPITKPAHLQSKKPLKRIDVQEVDSSVTEGIFSTKMWKTLCSKSATKTMPLKSSVPVDQASKIAMPTARPTASAESLIKTPPKVPSVPQTSYQFMIDWKKLRNFPEKKCEYVAQLTPDALARIFSQYIETEVFSDILDIICRRFLPSCCDPFSYLLALCRVGRFSTLRMFMTDEDRNNIISVLNQLEELGKYPKSDLQELAAKYGLTYT